MRELEGSGIKGVILQHLSLSFQAQAVGRSRPDVSLPSTPPDTHTHSLTTSSHSRAHADVSSGAGRIKLAH